MIGLRSTAMLLVMALALGCSSEAMSAGEHDHDTKHGGQFVLLENHQGVEFVISGDTITFHITENDKPADLMGASFKAIVQTDAAVKTYPLTVDGSTLKAKLATVPLAGAKVVITGKDGHGHILQARFVIK